MNRNSKYIKSYNKMRPVINFGIHGSKPFGQLQKEEKVETFDSFTSLKDISLSHLQEEKKSEDIQIDSR